jgi:very-short-patch-repair endonuclease
MNAPDKGMSDGGRFTSPCKGEVGREASGRGSAASRFARKPEMVAKARRLRGELSDAEQRLWRAMRRDQISGLGFRRQHAIGRYVLDFYCPSIRLAIEVDGGQHNFAMERKQDQDRTKWLEANGIHLIRFWNNDVLGNLNGVLSEIVRVSETLCSRRATPTLTLPLSGGGECSPRAPKSWEE